ncbi:16S rRNA methyltransferase GidB [Chitinispirillum alkaliphilum]|nr:16S rRNA methyltransferase GidB [Chitinispirillum alkaliphilum]
MTPIEYFKEYICSNFPDRQNLLMENFKKYHKWLVRQNTLINLISRKTDPMDIWTLHLLDSILPVPPLSIENQRVLDFGTGGGMPGIPLKVLFPSCAMTFLDSRAKKIDAVREAVEYLELEGCSFIAQRLEEISSSHFNQFDTVVCRSVRVEPRFKKPLLSLVKKGGRIILYKSVILDDVEQFDSPTIRDVSHPAIGTRRIVEIVKR